MKEGYARMNEMRDEIDYLQSILTEKKKLAKASGAKAEFLEKELKVLRSDIPCQANCEETLRKSLEELHMENVVLK